MRALKLVCLTVLLLLGACAQKPLRDVSTPGQSARPEASRAGTQTYTIDAKSSEVHILVYRAGTLARLGHNHVISSKSLRGEVWLHEDFARSGFDVRLPTATLIIDDPATRALYGEAFATEIPQKDIDGTRRNLMRPEVLDGDQFPEIKLVAAEVSGTRQAPIVKAQVTIKGATRELPVPMSLDLQAGRLTAVGEFELLQSDFGMKPFSIALGALQVRDDLHIKYRLVATRRLE